jgi:5-methylcytosine-specific restriction enzyme subunit McrC
MYEERIESQTFIKGKILVADTIRTHPILRHRHVVSFDEFSVNNPLNQIFKSLLIQLVSRTNSPENKKKIALAMIHLEDVEFVNLTRELFDRVRFNRLNTHFQPLFSLAKLFFYNRQPGLSHGKEKTMSFLIPINNLFQDFIAGILAGFSDSTYTFHHETNRLHLFSDGPTNRIQLRPDYTVTKGKEVIAIMDAKYKSALNEAGKVDLKESDVYQLCTYAMRYGVKKLALIYPKFHGTSHQDSLLANHTIDSRFGEVELRAIQVDVLERDLAAIVNILRETVYPATLQ